MATTAVILTLFAHALGLASAGSAIGLLSLRRWADRDLGAPARAWARVAEHHGMRSLGPRKIEGRIRELPVAAAWGPGGIAVNVSGLPPELVLGRGLVRAMRRSFGSVPQQQPPNTVEALRKMILFWDPHVLEVEEGHLRFVVTRSPSPRLLSHTIDVVIWLADLLRERRGLQLDLRHAALTDPRPRFRASMLDALVELSTEEGERAANVLLDDPDPLPRLVAARLLSDGLTLSAVALDRSASRVLRHAAFEYLARQPAWLAEAIGRLEEDDGPGALAAVAAAARAPTPEVCEALAARCALLAYGRTRAHQRAARATADLAARVRSDRLADATRAFLTLDEAAASAVAALGASGTHASLPALRAFGRSLSSFSPLRSQVANAIAAIRARSGSTGALTLAERAGGALSLAGSAREDGALSLPGYGPGAAL